MRLQRTSLLMTLAVAIVSLLGPYSSANAAAGSASLSTASSVSLQPANVAYAVQGLKQPAGLTLAPDQGLVIVDAGNGQIRKWQNSKLTILAGTAPEWDAAGKLQTGYLDSSANLSVFDHPTYSAVDSKGTIYVSDSDNHVIRKIKDGNVYTFAGTSEPGYQDGTREQALFNTPQGLAVDKADNVYVADTLNQVIRRITPDGQVSTYAGIAGDEGGYKDGVSDKALFNEPEGLAIDDRGGLYVSDSGNNLIRYIAADKMVSTFAGKPGKVDSLTGYMPGGYVNGERKQARFNHPRGLVYVNDTLFIADSLNNRVRAVTAGGKVINLAGQSAAGDQVGSGAVAQFKEPTDLAYTSGKLYISDRLNNVVKVLSVNPKLLVPVRTAEDIVASAELKPKEDKVQLWWDGSFVSSSLQIKPQMIKDNQYMPVRSLFEAWGAKVKWVPGTGELQLSKGSWSVSMKPNMGSQAVITGGNLLVNTAYLEKMTSFVIAYDEEFNAVVVDSGL